MATQETRDAVTEHFTALFAGEEETIVVRALRNIEDPEQPASRADLDRIFVYLRFPPHREIATALGGPTLCRREIGTFMPMVLTASGRGDGSEDGETGLMSVQERIMRSLRSAALTDGRTGDLIDILDFIGEDAGPKFGGNWYGAAFSVAYERDFISPTSA